MEDSLELVSLEFLSNPVKKVVESGTFEIIKPEYHLTWYGVLSRDTLIKVGYVNQFESTAVNIGPAEFLLVPTQKEPYPSPESLDHYKAYLIQDPVEFPVTLSLEDQFDITYGEPEYIDSLIPLYFLTPALKNMEQPELFDSVTHYVAYEILPHRIFQTSVNTGDQFGSHVLNVQESWFLLVPSEKWIPPPCVSPNIGCPGDETQNQNGVYTTTTQWTADDRNPGDPSVWLTSVAVDLTMLPPGISNASVNFTGCTPGPGCKSTNGTVTYTVSDHCQPGGPIYLIATNNCPSPPNADTCTFNVTLTNNPPVITQPDSLEGYVDSVVTYTFSGADPDSDVISDQASLTIQPSCGTYSVQRISGSGTASGTWQVTWQTNGCQDSTTYVVVHDLTDGCDTSYCTTYVHLSKPPRECDDNDPNECDTLWAECGNMRVPPGGGLVTIDLTIANDESLMAVVVPLSYEGSPVCCDSMPESENTFDKVFAGSIVQNWNILVVSIDHQAKTVVLAAVAVIPPNQCVPPGKGHFATLTLFGDSCCTIMLDTAFFPPSSHVEFLECNTQTLFYPVVRIDTCHIDRNNPPVIEQPDFLEGYVDDVVQYTIGGTDPDGDVILDSASIDIQPGCGSYSITRISGHGTSSGIWQITWNTDGCAPCDTHLVIHDLTDELGATAYCTTRVHLSTSNWYWKPPYEDYAPNGMPDIDQKQDNWVKQETGQFSFCGPVAVANCFKWFDSKYNVPPGAPGDGVDMFPLVRDYLDNNPPLVGFDDHDPWNVDHANTPWNPWVGGPPPTPQPFIPGPQQPGQVPSWGELVERLAWYFNTDGVQTGYCEFTGTNVMQMQEGIQMWLESETFADGSSLADTLCEVTLKAPTFATVESLVEKSEDVILLLGFWFEDPPGSGIWYRIGGHYVTVAGVNSTDLMIAFSDPFIDNAEMGGQGRVWDGSIISHPHGAHDATVHNDEGNVSHDIYIVDTLSVSPGGVWWLPDYPASLDPFGWTDMFFNQNVPDEFAPVTAPWNEVSPIVTEVEYAVHISPWDYRGDVNIPGGDGVVDLGDVVFLINYLFKGGPAPDPFLEGDVNCDGVIDLGDIVFLINYLFKNGPVPRCCDP